MMILIHFLYQRCLLVYSKRWKIFNAISIALSSSTFPNVAGPDRIRLSIQFQRLPKAGTRDVTNVQWKKVEIPTYRVLLISKIAAVFRRFQINKYKIFEQNDEDTVSYSV